MACNSCFCWRDIKRAIVAIGVFAMVTSLMQILITVAVFTGWLGLGNTFTFTPPANTSIAYELYIALSVFDFFMIVFSLVLVCGNERTNEARARSYFLPWLVLVPLYVIYESATNIYYFYNQFNGLFGLPLKNGNYGFAIVPLVYWVIKDLLLMLGWFVLAHRVHSFCPVHCCSLRPIQTTAVMQPATVTVDNPYYVTSPCSSTVVPVAPAPQAPSCGCGGGIATVNVNPPQATAVSTGGCGCGKSAYKMMQVQPVQQVQTVQMPTNSCYQSSVQMVPTTQMSSCTGTTQMPSMSPYYGANGGQFTVIGGGATRAPGAWTSSIYNSFFGRNNL